MKRKSNLFAICTTVLMLLVLCPLAVFAEDGEVTSKMAGTFWSLVPPVIAIGLALITKEVYSSLFVGILMGGLFAANFNVLKTVDAVVNDGLIAAVAGTAGIFIFLVVLGAIVALVNKIGRAHV